jgi:peroxiredoxin
MIPTCSFCQTGIEIIKVSAEKIKELKNITYNIYSENAYEKITADVTIERGNDLPIFETGKIRVNGIAINNAGSKQISYSYNGVSFDFIDLKNHELTKLDSPSYKKIGRTGMMAYDIIVLSPYWQKEPFGILLKQLTEAERLADTVIYNVPCYSVKVSMGINSEVMGNQKLESVWYFDKENKLICGHKLKDNDFYFLKTRSVNQEISNNFFSLAEASDVKKITGLEPISEGLLKTGTKAPSWSLPSSDNKTINLNDLKGKVVLLDFWGTWCVPCLRAMPDIQAIHEQFKNQPVEVIGVSVETEKKADPLGYIKRKGYTYTIVLDGDKITKDYKVAQFPSVFLIDKNGYIIHAEQGGNRENFKEDLINRIKEALNKRS